MRRVLLWAVLAVLTVLAVAAGAAKLQFETDSGGTESRAIVHFDAESRAATPDIDPALSLWKQCASHVNHVRVVAGPEAAGDGWTVTLEPALGEHTHRRLVGCLNDLTVDGVVGHYLGTDRRTR
ncbi:hypothetical protein [Nocardia sp. NPDC050710]|uniref:hypothetical protein n=1 Tax=Nocardia sp. NPDC050710 TaxID=3157220 RepID=UPI0034091CB1